MVVEKDSPRARNEAVGCRSETRVDGKPQSMTLDLIWRTQIVRSADDSEVELDQGHYMKGER